MVSLNDPGLRRTAASVEKYDAKSAIPQLGALLTVPDLQANTVRLETLVHLAVAHCQGHNCLGVTQIDEWLNNHLDNNGIASLEDPIEDVFVANVGTPEGNLRVFNGIWHSNDYFVQIIIDTLCDSKMARECRALLVPVFALLALSDRVAERVGLQRWHRAPSVPSGTVELPSASRVANRATAVTFTVGDLSVLGIDRDMLEPFIFRNEDKQVLASETIGHSSLERCPLVDLRGDLVLALPHAVSPAIMRFVLTELRRMGYLSAFSKELATHQARQVETDGLRELKGEADSLPPPKPDGSVPSLHAWLLKYDIDKYLHVVLLHDRLDRLDAEGLSSVMEIPDEQWAGLEKYLNQVSSHCKSLPEFAEGMTLLVIGGLGRNFAQGFKVWPDQWRFSVLQISDLLMLAAEADRPVARYLKCIKQKAWAEGKGVRFLSIDGDYNLYCYWRQQNYQLVPPDVRLAPESMLWIQSDFALPVRQEVRNLADRHVIQTVAGSYVPVMRLYRDTYFKSMLNRPIYVSLAHLSASMLAGAVETNRGLSWLLVKPREGAEHVLRFIYEVWYQFIELYGRLIFRDRGTISKGAGRRDRNTPQS